MISRRHQTIFVHIPKCAGQSVEMAFLMDEGLTWKTRAPLLLRPNKDPRLGPPRLAHLIASDYVARGHVTAEDFSAFYKFAVVRNPWSRAVSLYRHICPDMGFREFAGEWLVAQFSQLDASSFWFVRPQVDFVMHDGKLMVDDIIRFENIGSEFPRCAKRAQLRNALPHVNKAGQRTKDASVVRRLLASLLPMPMPVPSRFELHAHWRDYYDRTSIADIGRLYEVDCTTFGYGFHKPEHGA